MSQRSHITQAMQNYLDITDVRSRQSPVALESQLMNMAGIEIESLSLRIGRETSQTIQTVPTNIDRGGVYYSYVIPSQFSQYLTGADQTSFDNVVVENALGINVLSIYDDTLPVPNGVVIDRTNVVALSDPVLFTISGIGDSLHQIYAVQYVYPGTFPIPNALTLWVDQIGLNEINIVLTITGQVAPQPAWVAERQQTTESIQITSEGVAYTRNRWTSIEKIAIRNLPVGVRLRGWSIPFNLPAAPDPGRPYTEAYDRDILYPRYWQISNTNNLLYEMYCAQGFTGLTPINSYSVSDTMTDIAVEPFTNGIYVCSANTLYYADRREYQADLTKTGLLVEPLYGLRVVQDITKVGATRYAALWAEPYGGASSIAQYRYTVVTEGSLNVLYSILPNGAIGPSNAGWRAGPPKPVSFPMITAGDYEFRLELQDTNGNITYDIVPYRNAAFAPLITIDMSSTVDSIQGMAFDSYGQLWIWNGSYAMPLTMTFGGYVFDATNQTLYATESFSSIVIS